MEVTRPTYMVHETHGNVWLQWTTIDEVDYGMGWDTGVLCLDM